MTLIKMGVEYVLVDGKNSKFFSNEDKLIESGVLPPIEIVYAIAQLNANKHNVAKFGCINNLFLYTDNTESTVKVWH